MGDLTKNLSRRELACKCGCNMEAADHELVEVIQKAAEDLGMRYHITPHVTITSGNRCPKHNKAVGGAPDSRHLRGTAADHYFRGVPPEAVYEYYDRLYPNKYGLGLYNGRVHLDVRAEKTRWDQRGSMFDS